MDDKAGKRSIIDQFYAESTEKDRHKILARRVQVYVVMKHGVIAALTISLWDGFKEIMADENQKDFQNKVNDLVGDVSDAVKKKKKTPSEVKRLEMQEKKIALKAGGDEKKAEILRKQAEKRRLVAAGKKELTVMRKPISDLLISMRHGLDEDALEATMYEDSLTDEQKLDNMPDGPEKDYWMNKICGPFH
jgi:chromosome condensin MukBEF complex kleisin-like MukF subunit